MQFNINLATRNYINVRQLNLITAIIVIILLLFLAYSIGEIASNWGEAKRLGQQITVLEKKLKGDTKSVPAKEYEAMLAKIHFANSVIDKKNLDWINFLDQLEVVTPEGVALSAVDPDVVKNTLKLTGYSKNLSTLRTFFENLASSPYFRNVSLETQTETQVGENQKGVSFAITCTVIY